MSADNSERGNGFSMLPLAEPLDGPVEEMNGTDTLPTSQAISESGFGKRLPDYPVHNQTGDVRKKRVIRQILEDQEYLCYLTGVNLTPETAELDHIIPISKGGHPIDARNVGFLDTVVNKMKGSMELSEFIQWCKMIAERFE